MKAQEGSVFSKLSPDNRLTDVATIQDPVFMSRGPMCDSTSAELQLASTLIFRGIRNAASLQLAGRF